MYQVNNIIEYLKRPFALTFFSALLTSQFFLGGVNKIRGFGKTVTGLQQRFNHNLPGWFYQFVIMGVILLEIIAPIMVVLTTMRKVKKEYGILSLLLLAIFTILATYLYHFPPVGFTFYPFISNVSAIGGLLSLAVLFAAMN